MAAERVEAGSADPVCEQANNLAARSALAARQEALVRALTGAAEPPPGFDAERVRRTGHALLTKRWRSAGRAWPGLATALAEQFRPLFETYARTHPIPPGGTPFDDGYAFALHLQRDGRLPESAKLELMLARCRRGGWPVRFVFLHSPLRLAVAVRLPRRQVRWCLIRLGPSRL